MVSWLVEMLERKYHGLIRDITPITILCGMKKATRIVAQDIRFEAVNSRITRNSATNLAAIFGDTTV
jgi:hypothetical protein